MIIIEKVTYQNKYRILLPEADIPDYPLRSIGFDTNRHGNVNYIARIYQKTIESNIDYLKGVVNKKNII